MRKLPQFITSAHHNESTNTTFQARIYNNQLMFNRSASAPQLGNIIVDPSGQKYMISSPFSLQQGEIISYDLTRLHHFSLDILRHTTTGSTKLGRPSMELTTIAAQIPCISFSAERGLVTIQPHVPAKPADLIAVDTDIRYIVRRVGTLPSGLKLVRFEALQP